MSRLRLGADSSGFRHALSVDVEEWFHTNALRQHVGPDADLESTWPARAHESTRELLDLMDETQTKATFYVLGRMAVRHPDLVRDIARRGHEVATHGFSHARLDRLSRAEFRSELRESVRVLEALAGRPVLGHRAPSFSLHHATAWALDEILDAGLRYDSSLRGGPGRGMARPHWAVAPTGRSIAEYPLAAIRTHRFVLPFGGGGYLRLFPYSVTRLVLRRFAATGIPANVFLHPWEIDPHHPRPAGLSALATFRHYYGLAKTLPRLRRLLRDFLFTPVCELPPVLRDAVRATPPARH